MLNNEEASEGEHFHANNLDLPLQIQIPTLDEFESPRKNIRPPPIYVADELSSEDDETDPTEAGCCTICFEPWTSSGRHRICSLKCGHLFGRSCIERWLNVSASANANLSRTKCPQCNAPAKRSEIRTIYAKMIIALDADEKERLEVLVEAERQKRIKAEEANAKAGIMYRMALIEIDRCHMEIERLRRSSAIVSNPLHDPFFIGFDFWKTLPLAALGDGEDIACRYMNYAEYFGRFLITHTCNGAIIPESHGILKVSSLDISNTIELVGPLHSKSIRAIAVSPFGDSLFLTTAGDGFLKLSSAQSNSTVLSYRFPDGGSSGTSCTFDEGNKNRVVAGLASGALVEFDLRSTKEAIQTIRPSVIDRKMPVHTIMIKEDDIVGATLDGPFLVNRAFGQSPSWNKVTFSPPIENSACSSLIHDATSSTYLASFRSMPTTRPTQHVLFKAKHLALEDCQKAEIEELVRFQGPSGQKVLCKSALFTFRDKLLATVGNEPSNGLDIYSFARTEDDGCKYTRPKLQQSLATNSATSIVDIRHAHASGDSTLLAALNERQLLLYRCA